MNFNFLSLNTNKTETKTHTITEDFHSISIYETTADVTFLPSEDDTVKVVCHDQKRQTHAVSVQNGVLSIKLINTRRWYDYISLFNFSEKKTTVYLPKDVYKNITIKTNTGDIKVPEGYAFENVSLNVNTGNIGWSASVSDTLRIETDTGNVTLSNTTLGSLKLETDTGNVKMQNIKATGLFDIETDTGDQTFINVLSAGLKTEADTGDIKLTDTVISGNLDIETSTGDVKFTRADAANLYIETSTGDVKGSLRTGKIFTAKSSTGKERVPQNDRNGGDCRIKCSTGDINITVEDVTEK